jgi:hypothetical protein
MPRGARQVSPVARTNAFAETFREMVIPELSKRCRKAGFCIERGRWTFTEGHAFVMDLARHRGAYCLPLHVLDDLDQWIDAQILKASIDMENDDTRRAYVRESVL